MALFSIDETNWQYASVLNEIVYAIEERRKAVGLEPMDDEFFPVRRGGNIQTASFWNSLTDGIDEACSVSRGLKLADVDTIHGAASAPFASAKIDRGQNLQKYIKDEFIPLMKEGIRKASMVIDDDVSAGGNFEDPSGCYYPELIVNSVDHDTPPNLGGMVVVLGRLSDDLLVVNGIRLDSLHLLDSYGGGDCPNGKVGYRKYKNNFIECGNYSAGSKINATTIDIFRARWSDHHGIGYVPDFKYYRFTPSSYLSP